MTTIHHVGNRSLEDSDGRLRRFVVVTMCGRSVHAPTSVTDRLARVTCRGCLRVMGCWGGAYAKRAEAIGRRERGR